jgi:hypothetical protein
MWLFLRSSISWISCSTGKDQGGWGHELFYKAGTSTG